VGAGRDPRAGCVHLDLKPANVRLDEHGDARVADFGLARDLDCGAPHSGTWSSCGLIGTPEFMFPEQVECAGTVEARTGGAFWRIDDREVWLWVALLFAFALLPRAAHALAPGRILDRLVWAVSTALLVATLVAVSEAGGLGLRIAAGYAGSAAILVRLVFVSVAASRVCRAEPIAAG